MPVSYGILMALLSFTKRRVEFLLLVDKIGKMILVSRSKILF